LVEKWNPPTRSETAKIGKKIEGILGVNSVQSSGFFNFVATMHGFVGYMEM
jgi:hypothetical protein